MTTYPPVELAAPGGAVIGDGSTGARAGAGAAGPRDRSINDVEVGMGAIDEEAATSAGVSNDIREMCC